VADLTRNGDVGHRYVTNLGNARVILETLMAYRASLANLADRIDL
jgi:hypothetical protein